MPGRPQAHDHGGHSPAVSVHADLRWLTAALAINAGFMILEVVVGLIASSLAVLSDAAHMRHLIYTLRPSPEGTSLHQRETVNLLWPLRWFSTRVESHLCAQLSIRVSDLRDLLQAGT